jgi:hypothetical protein
MSPRLASIEECSKKILDFAMKLKNDSNFNQIFNEDEVSELKTLLKESYNWTQENKYASKVEINDFNHELENKINNFIDKAQERHISKKYVSEVKNDLGNHKFLSKDEKERILQILNDHEDVAEYSSHPDRIKRKRKDTEVLITSLLNTENDRMEFDNKLKQISEKVNSQLEEYKNISNEKRDKILNEIDSHKKWMKGNLNSTFEISEKEKELDKFINETLYVTESKAPIQKSEQRKKLENMTTQIYQEMDNNKKLDEKNKENIKKILKNSEKWLNSNPNATDKEIKQYSDSLFHLLGPQSEYKFKVFASVNYGFGVASGDDKKFGKYVNPNEEKPSYYYESYLGQWERNKKLQEEKLAKVTRNPMLSDGTSSLAVKNYPFESHYSIGKRNEKSIDEIKSKMINPIMQSNPMNLTLHSRGNRSSIGSHSVIQQSSSSENPKQSYSYEQLKMSSGSSFPSEIDISKREIYLSDDEFKELFNMNKLEFSKLPEWRKKRLKQDLNLW